MAKPFALRRPVAPESDLLRATLSALTLHRVFHWRNNSSVTVLGVGKSRRVIRGAPAGSPDILLIIPGTRGQLGGLECKTEAGRQNANQKSWELKATAHGVRYGVVRSVSSAIALVKRWELEARAA